MALSGSAQTPATTNDFKIDLDFLMFFRNFAPTHPPRAMICGVGTSCAFIVRLESARTWVIALLLSCGHVRVVLCLQVGVPAKQYTERYMHMLSTCNTRLPSNHYIL